MTKRDLQAPFVYFGGKSRVAGEVWRRLGQVDSYIEPFCGSAAVLLGRPGGAHGMEVLNDKFCMIANFWRAVAKDPDAVLEFCDYHRNEAELHSRHIWLFNRLPELREQCMEDVEFYDAQVAAWWCCGFCDWLRGGWCLSEAKAHTYSKPALAPPKGLLTTLGRPEATIAWLHSLRDRLRAVTVCCGDWKRCVPPGMFTPPKRVGVFLDPPYTAAADRTPGCYAQDDLEVGQEVAAWALEYGQRPNVRVAVCGYRGEYEFPDDWEAMPWKAHGGFARIKGTKGLDNACREMVWFSPNCVRVPNGYRR